MEPHSATIVRFGLPFSVVPKMALDHYLYQEDYAESVPQFRSLSI